MFSIVVPAQYLVYNITGDSYMQALTVPVNFDLKGFIKIVFRLNVKILKVIIIKPK